VRRGARPILARPRSLNCGSHQTIQLNVQLWVGLAQTLAATARLAQPRTHFKIGAAFSAVWMGKERAIEGGLTRGVNRLGRPVVNAVRGHVADA
jgi:hypothetical protein